MGQNAGSGERGAPALVIARGRGAKAGSQSGAKSGMKPGARPNVGSDVDSDVGPNVGSDVGPGAKPGAKPAVKNGARTAAQAAAGAAAGPDPAAVYPGHAAFLPYVLNRATSALNADFQLVLREHGMTLLHWRVLAFLRDADGLGVSALASITGSDQATLSRALTVMEKAGYVARHPDPMDQRVAVIRLCPAGRKQFARVLPIALRLHLRAVAGLSQEEQETLIGLLNRMRTNVLTREA